MYYVCGTVSREEAERELEQLAKQGEVKAQYTLAVLLDEPAALAKVVMISDVIVGYCSPLCEDAHVCRLLRGSDAPCDICT